MPLTKVDPNDPIWQELIDLMEADDGETAKSALATGRPLLQRMGLSPTSGGMIGYVLDLLKTRYPMHELPLGDPPGCHGIGYVMNNSDGNKLYIKFKINEVSFSEKRFYILSFKTSDHS